VRNSGSIPASCDSIETKAVACFALAAHQGVDARAPASTVWRWGVVLLRDELGEGGPMKAYRLGCLLAAALVAASVCQPGGLVGAGTGASATVRPAAHVDAAVTKAQLRPAFDQCGFSGAFQTRLVRPKSIIIACGDGNIGLVDLHWTSWGQTTATASGVDTWNTCVPDCAASKNWDKTAVLVTLTHPVPEPKGPLFGLLTVRGTRVAKSPGLGKYVFLPNACSPSNRSWTESEGQPCPAG
jgi:hypothetical protein